MAIILIAEDDADIRDLVVFKLEQSGHTVIPVGDGRSALRMAHEKDPDIVLLDVMMPGMSGIDVCRELRRDARTAELPIILLTARAQESDVENGLTAGADDYIVKPFSPRVLAERVQSVLTRTRA
ncbi:response regulator transcription factor [Planomonospora sp. ID82291]|uniref:response regulator transcription factor n=1 Tax=Planomonospora sp. ID82291 TaxID=2738136 RepID=UPI0018C40B58|nr:response regulator [Planomonospora sp. ID82291]MBG0818586.1 response regulator [Planomonospora sp. ID82291]